MGITIYADNIALKVSRNLAENYINSSSNHTLQDTFVEIPPLPLKIFTRGMNNSRLLKENEKSHSTVDLAIVENSNSPIAHAVGFRKCQTSSTSLGVNLIIND